MVPVNSSSRKYVVSDRNPSGEAQLVLPVCPPHGEKHTARRSYRKKVSFECDGQATVRSTPGRCSRHLYQSADSNASSEPDSCRSIKSQGSQSLQSSDCTPRTCSCTPHRSRRSKMHQRFRSACSPKESHREKRRKRVLSKCNIATQTNAPSATQSLKSAYAKVAGTSGRQEPAEEEYVNAVGGDEAIAVARYKVIKAQKDCLEAETERLIGTSLHVGWTHLKSREDEASSKIQLADRLKVRDRQMQAQFLREVTALRDRIRKFPDGVTEAMEIVTQEEQAKMNEILESKQESNSRVAPGVDVERIERRVEYYEPLTYLEDDMRLLVLDIVEEKLKMIFTYDPACREKVDTMTYAVFEQQLTAQRLEQHRKENKRLSDELRDLNIKYHEALGEIERLTYMEDHHRQLHAAANVKMEEDLAAAEEKSADLQQQLQRETATHAQTQKALQKQAEELESLREIVESQRKTFAKQKSQIAKETEEKVRLHAELHSAKCALKKVTHTIGAVHMVQNQVAARQSSVEAELDSEEDEQRSEVETSNAEGNTTRSHTVFEKIKKAAAHVRVAEKFTLNDADQNLDVDGVDLNDSDEKVDVEGMDLSDPEELEKALEEDSSGCSIRCRMVRLAYRDLQARYKCLETERGLLSLERNELETKVAALEQMTKGQENSETPDDDEAAHQRATSLVDTLQDSDPFVRKAAMKSLATLGRHAIKHADVIATVLMDDDHDVRKTAVRALNALGEGAGAVAGTTLAKTLKHENWQIRLLAAEALGNLKKEGTQHAHALVEALQDSNAKVRRAAAKALGDVSSDAEVVSTEKLVTGAAPVPDDTDDVWSITLDEMESQIEEASRRGATAKGSEPEFRGSKLDAEVNGSKLHAEASSKVLSEWEMSEVIERASRQGHVRSGFVRLTPQLHDPTLPRQVTRELTEMQHKEAAMEINAGHEAAPLSRKFRRAVNTVIAVRGLRQNLGRQQHAALAINSRIQSLTDEINNAAEENKHIRESLTRELQTEVERRSALENKVQELEAALQAQVREATIHVLSCEASLPQEEEEDDLCGDQIRAEKCTLPVPGDTGSSLTEAEVGSTIKMVNTFNEKVGRRAQERNAMLRSQLEFMLMEHKRIGGSLNKAQQVNHELKKELRRIVESTGCVNEKAALDKLEVKIAAITAAPNAPSSVHERLYHDAKLREGRYAAQGHLAAQRKLNNSGLRPARISGPSPTVEETQIENGMQQPRGRITAAQLHASPPSSDFEQSSQELPSQVPLQGPKIPTDSKGMAQPRGWIPAAQLHASPPSSDLEQWSQELTSQVLFQGPKISIDGSDQQLKTHSRPPVRAKWRNVSKGVELPMIIMSGKRYSNDDGSREATPERSMVVGAHDTNAGGASHTVPRRPQSRYATTGVASADAKTSREDGSLSNYMVRGRRPSKGSSSVSSDDGAASPMACPSSSVDKYPAGPKPPVSGAPSKGRPHRVFNA
eukprot:gnl/MRDRNA2_/MRDRNA2_92919_c0_seq1.p1 gnl/MRDRNA2_/MRDRNA2_92919_c0~~gnl/MRDRNA2_/MRDRNA2_92919_c0_seq1.p1  ORF type:complete len:1469 (+),score=339.19 gnl/MRDRNA2_/MRDRNA2_92919_c0_seq1:119-4525(+)